MHASNYPADNYLIVIFSEEIFQTISRAVDRGRWWSVSTEVVARVMVDNSVTEERPGLEILEQRDIIARGHEEQR